MVNFRSKTYAGGGGPGKVIEATATTKDITVHGQFEADGTEVFAASDTIELCVLPKGFVITAYQVVWTDFGTGTFTVDIGQFNLETGGGLDIDGFAQDIVLVTAGNLNRQEPFLLPPKMAVETLVKLTAVTVTSLVLAAGATLDIVFSGSVVTDTSGS